MNETIEIKAKEIKYLIKQASKKHSKTDSKSLVLEYAVKKQGLYRLRKVVDQSNLEVQRRTSDTLVVNCPKAVIKPSTLDRCVGDLSDLTIDVRGTPPMKIVYSRTINKKDQSFHFQSIQPENLMSPLLGSSDSTALVSSHNEDVSWGRSYSIEVRLNESMTPSGKWLYSIDEVHDSAGNVANFSARGEDGEHIYPKGSHLEHAFNVHERPVVHLKDCDTHNPMRVARGASSTLPVEFGSPGPTHDSTRHTITWQFSPIDKLTANGDHGDDVIIEEFVSKHPRQKPEIRRAGLYTLKTITNQFCDGEIKEPASCLLLNPPEPELSITSENIYDKCAGNSIGLLVDLDLIGTPPFFVHYDIIRNKQRRSHKVRVEGSRHQLELKPTDAGHFTYRFTTIEDSIYGARPLSSDASLTLEQDVKPPASAYIVNTSKAIVSCIEESIDVEVLLQGEAPFTLEYEIVHNGKRQKYKVPGIQKEVFLITTEPLVHGGDYALALASVQDRNGCKIFLSDEMKISVRQQRPKASFGVLDGKRKIMALEGQKIRLPLRLEGVAPWSISYRKADDHTGEKVEVSRQDTNDFLEVDERGIYEIIGVSDSHCPGSVEPTSATFEVDWISRPTIKLANNNQGLTLDGEDFRRREVCEGDVDAVEISLFGRPVHVRIHFTLC
jgi:nucleoporin POM152